MKNRLTFWVLIIATAILSIAITSVIWRGAYIGLRNSYNNFIEMNNEAMQKNSDRWVLLCDRFGEEFCKGTWDFVRKEVK